MEALAASKHAAHNSREHAVGVKLDGTALLFCRRAAEIAQKGLEALRLAQQSTWSLAQAVDVSDRQQTSRLVSAQSLPPYALNR
jgi:hypothetical protein